MNESDKSFWKRSSIFFAILGVVFLYLVYTIYWNLSQSSSATDTQSKDTQTSTLLSAEQMRTVITADALYNAINEVRTANNLTPFSRNPQLDQSAKLKCDDMVAGNYYEHHSPTTGKPGNDYITEILKSHGYTSENLNLGYFNSAKEVVDSWMGSESHKASIIDPKFTEIGFATCIIPNLPDRLAIVQHKIEPAKPQAQVNNYYTQPSYRSYTPTTTTCNYNEWTSSATCQTW